MTKLAVATVYATLLITGCASTVPVTLENWNIATKTQREIGRSGGNESLDKTVPVIQFNISSKKELHNFFVVERNAPIYVLCRAQGSSRIRNNSNFGYGPFYEGINISTLIGEKKNSVAINSNFEEDSFIYSIYAFPNLKAGYGGYSSGVPQVELDLEKDRFERISCRVKGVVYPPFRQPRSKDFGIDKRTLLTALEKWNSTKMHRDLSNQPGQHD